MYLIKTNDDMFTEITMNTKTPAYAKVFTDLSQKIKDGTYPSGSLLPSESELEEIYSVSRTTIRKAVGMLVSDHKVRVKQGYGTEVLAQTNWPPAGRFRFHGTPTITEHLPKGPLRSTPISIDKVAAPEVAANFLKVDPGTPIYRVQRLISSAETNEIAAYRINYLLPKTFPNLDRFDRMHLSLYTLLYNQYKLSFSDGYETITPISADFIIAQILNTQVGAPLFLMQRYANSTNVELEYAEIYMLPKFYEIRIHMTGSPLDSPQNVEASMETLS